MNIFKKNFKIYTFLLGIIVGTIVFNVISADFSFEDIYNIKINDFIGNFIFVILYLIKYIIFYSILMIIKEKNVVAGISPICSGAIFFRFNYNNSLYPKLYLYMWNNNSNNKNSHNLTLFNEMRLEKRCCMFLLQ